ncbi:MAG: hypothetical protein LLF92_00540 [Planctomycetaceae bacterium]|nr:hypothetical protein [Planctomycetaceae bacterium]
MKKSLIVLCVLAMCSVVWAEEKKAEEVKKEKPDYRSVIVDAWLVRVDADALAESGVKPLSEKEKENVSVMNLMWCLSEPNCGEVVTSARTMGNTKAEIENNFQQDIYLTESTEAVLVEGRTVKGRTSNSYNLKVDFKTYSQVLENKQVGISWSFFSRFICDKSRNKLPPDTGNLSYENHWGILPTGKSVIVGQSQIGKDMFFLVMKAEIVE